MLKRLVFWDGGVINNDKYQITLEVPTIILGLSQMRLPFSALLSPAVCSLPAFDNPLHPPPPINMRPQIHHRIAKYHSSTIQAAAKVATTSTLLLES